MVNKKKYVVCGMCLFFSGNWCNKCGQIVVAPTPDVNPTVAGIPRNKMDKACGQFTPKGTVEHLTLTNYDNEEQ